MVTAAHPAPSLMACALPWLVELRREGGLRDFVRAHPTSAHLVHPGVFAETIEQWLVTGREHNVPVALRFGKKANKSPAFARECARFSTAGEDVGVDVASVEEFAAALATGNRGERLVVTGPTHSAPLLHLAAQHHATVAVSTLGDLERVRRLVGPMRLAVLLRLRTEETSRFGIEEAQLAQLVRSAPTPGVSIRGVSFHCSGYGIDDRVRALMMALDLLDVGRAAGHPMDTISAGGGWPVNHVAGLPDLAPPLVWEQYWARLEPGHFLTSTVPTDSYPYGVAPSGPAAFAAFLDSVSGRKLQERGLTLMVEPGRALCTGAGVSIFPVLSTEDHPRRGRRVGVTVVDGTSFSLSEQWFATEFFPDPLLCDPDGTPVRAEGEPYGAAIAGRTCLESDVLSRRFVPLPRRPKEGDLLIYPDTAGYQMDSNESAFHDIPVPRKYAVCDTTDHRHLREDV